MMTPSNAVKRTNNRSLCPVRKKCMIEINWYIKQFHRLLPTGVNILFFDEANPDLTANVNDSHKNFEYHKSNKKVNLVLT